MNSFNDFPTLDPDQLAAPVVSHDTIDIAEISGGQVTVKLSRTEAAIAMLQMNYRGAVFDMTTAVGDKAARAARQELVQTRTRLEAKRRELKAPALSFGSLIDSEAKRLNEMILELERPIDEQIKADEERRARIKREAEEAEAKRVAAHMEGIATIRSYLSRAEELGLQPERIEAGINALRGMVFDQSWQEFADQAEVARRETIGSMVTLLAKVQATIAAKAESDQLRAENERLRAQLAEFAAWKAEQERKSLDAEVSKMRQADEVATDSVSLQHAGHIVAAPAEAATPVIEDAPKIEVPREPPTDEPKLMLGDICRKVGIGFSMTSEFVATLGYSPSVIEGRSRLYTKTQLDGIKASLIKLIQEKL